MDGGRPQCFIVLVNALHGRTTMNLATPVHIRWLSQKARGQPWRIGRAPKRGYFEGFFSELHTKSLPNRPFEQIWCEMPSFSGVNGGGVLANAHQPSTHRWEQQENEG
ncbi:hypothetical protein FRC0036_01920 [Corynebacterium diphtheriae]|nr:hypothetical protein FRC0030_01920 [Corynebacterium diphtheriae]CAB0710080.1 hypothetical protein FRC0036_01920 [Corynebacterium diphtheriae]CAB0710151.1 hypothetical protein FRC0025_01946 [Corynebacterium diphtheriae]CAB0775540.1 hypothetical protein FRC0172_01682 [Corynebacterium diphtheriae]